ncbi:MAG: tRNA (adenosine(37)-N6)-threonylcarbamoyltransferase complex ATPase subunit type 1 TsaE [Brevinematales bacterium]|nr:tRNA (adenosine(37)-N6)-threonylcarbamoyltransferase complex ATPase subunit type 1 TsaE [Brevinematales bacterium]
MIIEYITAGHGQTGQVGADYARALPRKSVLLLTGDLGAGKTCFARGFVNELIPGTLVSSPTFTLVNEYRGNDYTVSHLDLYRLKSGTEAAELGLEDIIEASDYTLIEWPEIAETLLEIPVYRVRILMGAEENQRILQIEGELKWNPSISA